MSFSHTRVVIWRNPETDWEVLRQKLGELGCEVHPVASFEEARAAILAKNDDLVVSWLAKDSRKSFELLDWLQSRPTAPAVILVTASGDVDLYLEAMQRGAFDCVGLPLDSRELTRIVTRALESRCASSLAGGG